MAQGARRRRRRQGSGEGYGRRDGPLEEDEKVFAEEVKKRMMVIPTSSTLGAHPARMTAKSELERFGDPVVPDFPVPYH